MTARITDVRTALLRVPLDSPQDLPVGRWVDRRNLVVIVETSAGIRGTGEIWINFPAWGCEDRVAVVREVLRPLLVDEPLDDPRRLFRLMTEKTRPLARRWYAHGPVSHAIAGVDIAVWDAYARQDKVPLRDAIAGHPVGARVEVYASGIGPGPAGPAIEQAIADGHTRFKPRLISGPEIDRRQLRESREAAGDRILMADPAETYTSRSILEIWPDIVAADVDWLEEPFPTDEPAMYDELAGWTPRPRLALGESNYGLAGLKAMIDRFNPGVVQPDITKTGGISEGIEILKMVIASGREVVPHMLGGPIGFVASANLVAAIDQVRMVEMDIEPLATFGPMLGGMPAIVEGAIELPADPGHGATFNESDLGQWLST